MIAKYNRRSLAIGVPGLLIQFACVILIDACRTSSEGLATSSFLSIDTLLILGFLLGIILLIAGLCYYSKAKGYSALLGLLGLASAPGLLILSCLPDRMKNQTTPAQ